VRWGGVEAQEGGGRRERERERWFGSKNFELKKGLGLERARRFFKKKWRRGGVGQWGWSWIFVSSSPELKQSESSRAKSVWERGNFHIVLLNL
jgi:hypothetical protein